MIIKIDNLQEIAIQLLSKLKEKVGSDMEISKDYYWCISDDELYNPYQEPENLTVGQLSDDIIELERLLKKDEAISYDIKRLSEILKAVSSENIAL
ncbi:MAG: hypothetical protein LBH82_03480 [Bacteroidales bacterium]|jgi:hypothetical protein|nr:hypothetical protein [Bacteroidales bacterium]